MNSPNVIYLQDIRLHEIDITWCSEQINDEDVKYIREDKADALLEALRAIRGNSKDMYEYCIAMGIQEGISYLSLPVTLRIYIAQAAIQKAKV